MSEQLNFVDAESHSSFGKEDFSFKYIMLRQLSRITFLNSREWKGGHWTEKIKAMGGASFVEKAYVPDTREEFENAVYCLMDLLLPYADDKLLKVENDVKDECVDLNELAKKNNYSKEEHLNIHVKIVRKLFRELSCFLKRINYLENQNYEDSV
jgi:hypothetical protein